MWVFLPHVAAEVKQYLMYLHQRFCIALIKEMSGILQYFSNTRVFLKYSVWTNPEYETISWYDSEIRWLVDLTVSEAGGESIQVSCLMVC